MSQRPKVAVSPPLPQGWDARLTDSGRQYFVDHNTHSTSWNHPLNSQSTPTNTKSNWGPAIKDSTPKDNLPPSFRDAIASDVTTVTLGSDDALAMNLGYPSRTTSEASPAMTADAEGPDDPEDLTLDDTQQNTALELQLKQIQDANQKGWIKGLTNKTEKLEKENKELRATISELQNAQEQAAQKQQGLDATDFLIWSIRSQKLRRALSSSSSHSETDTKSPVLTAAKEVLAHLEELSNQLQEQVAGSSLLVGSRNEVAARFGRVLGKRMSESDNTTISCKKARL
ncbi:hypothetical protein CPB85DRAFT_1431123 [Mucidula mucida]|nr:hypothetical protein CPB85DRAFT_1443894 [Mucidula mucida]KAF8917584.1 hypothetical protein CPB85DRAFT_1431123 [Mucidula mucida]